MPKELHDLVPRHTHIVMPYAPVAATRAEYMRVPRERGNLALMPAHRPELLAGLNVPELDVTCAESDAEEQAVVGEADGGDIRAVGGVADVGHGTCIGTPDVCAGFEGDDDNVEGGPGDEVEVKVVDHAGSVEDAFGLSGEASRFVGGGSCGGGEGCGAGVEGPDKLSLLGEGGVGRGGGGGRGLFVVAEYAAVEVYPSCLCETGCMSWGSRDRVEMHLLERCDDVGVIASGYETVAVIAVLGEIGEWER
jgi:hypothetical protein